MNVRLFVFFGAGLAAALYVSSAAAQTLKIATIAPEGSSWMTDMRRSAEVIAERTDGRVHLKFYGGGVQGNDKQVQRKMRTGQLHGGAFTSGGMNRFQRDADLLGLPFMFNSIEEARQVREWLEPIMRQRLDEAGFVNFGFAAAGFAYMMSNKPLRTLADLKGQKVWTPQGDRVSYAALNALGVAPVTMPITDVMTGLQTDLLNSVTVPPVGALVFQWHTRLKYIAELPVVYVYGALLIDKAAFARVSQADQQVLREVLEAMYRQFDERGVVDNAEALQALLDSGLEIASPAPQEVAEWREIVMASNRALARQGVFDAELLDRMQAFLKEYRAGRPVTD
ncbi:MAG: TRAP transporter substrate-binding protein DctP [Xanthomonadales bacterium]|nr:TRAP transporter substrate-binding protein DctP [Xanthomonadales bacterium]